MGAPSQLPNMRSLYDRSYLKNLIETRRSVVVFGCTKVGIWCFEYLKRMQVDVVSFADDRAEFWNESFHGLPVRSPSDVAAMEEVDLIVAGDNYLKISRVFESFGRSLPIKAHTHYSPHVIKGAIEDQSELDEVYAGLADDWSREVFLTVLESRVSLEAQNYRSIFTAPKYFPPDIFTFSDDEVFVDGGAHMGETTLSFLDAARLRFSRVFCFEPERRCTPFIARLPLPNSMKKKIEIVTAGLYDRDGYMSFKTTDSTASSGTSEIVPSASTQGDDGSAVRVVALDSFLQGAPITFLKMDLEKSELPALRGAANTIQEFKPKLAITVYHLHDDLWKIPLMIKNLVPEYELYLRHHSFAENETVLYAKI